MPDTSRHDANRAGSPGNSPPAFVLIAAATGAVVALGSALVNVVWGAVAGGGYLVIRETPVIWVVRYLSDALGAPILIELPEIVNQSLNLHTISGLVLFLVGVTIANLAWIAIAACALLVAWPILGRALARFPRRREAKAGAVFTFVFTLPMTVGLVDHFLRSQRQARTVAIALVASVILAAAAFWLLSWRRRNARVALWRITVVSVVTILLLAVAAAGTLLATRQRVTRMPPRPGAPNVLLVSIDSLRADRLHCYGNPRPTSPTIDRLAARGALFEHAIAPTSWTLPSHMTLMTALPPTVHGVNEDYLKLREGVPTIASVLRNDGYVTAGIVTGTYLDRRFGFGEGFDQYDDYTLVPSSPRFQRRGHSANRLARMATRWLDHWSSGGRKRPFFLFLHFWDVHFDYMPPPPFDTMFDPGYHGPIDGTVRISSTVHPGMPKKDLRHLIALYDGEIRSTDTSLGQVVAWLRNAGVLDHTIVVVVSDHGDEFLEHGTVGHRSSLYDELIHVPIVFRYPPKVPAGDRVRAQVRLMDVAPTILSLAGIQRRIGVFDTGGHRTWMATDLSPLLHPDRAGAMPPLPAFSNLEDRLVSLRTTRAKIIENLEHGTKQFYDLAADPGEHSNRWNPDDPAATALLTELERYVHHVKGSALAEPTRLTREQKDALRSLGYLH